ncbi:glycosyltransferase family 4 protein [Desulfogranum mediterraneum]|uniref:glycosyltransferase family 4 protein n=1 Tax=Desulfogranum mediterraneum TaxID=160661 RepID=UPI00068787BB|nr:glycosyltransferase family 4 protein [Desulfogranum mediterraneum]
MEAKTHRICFLLGSPDINGGTYVIYEHGSRLHALGHEVTIVTQEAVTPDRYAWHPGAKTLEWLTFDEARSKQFDLVLATWWQSPFMLAELSASHYAYFVQSIESRFFENTDPAHHDKYNLDVWSGYCEMTYSINIPIITEARWIKDYLFDRYNHQAFLVPNGIRKDVYLDSGDLVAQRKPGKLRVLVEGPVDVHYKNVPKSIELCRKAEVDEVWLLTSSEVAEVEGVDRVFSRVPIHETPAIYRSCDLLVKLSYIEGMFGPPLEMFHCGGTAIVYDVTGHDEYIVHDENSYVAARDDEQRVVDYLVSLKKNPSELQRLKRGAEKTAASWPDWQAAAHLFNGAVNEILRMPSVSRAYLQRWTTECNQANTAKLRDKEVELFQRREEAEGKLVVDNFVQLYYWAEQEGLDGSKFSWAHYKSGGQVEVSLQIPLTGFPFRLRLDPSVRIGVIEMTSIVVKASRTDEALLSIDTPEAFSQLSVGGTLRRLSSASNAAFFSYGDDPQLILPPINRGELGDELVVVISLKEMSVQTFVNHAYREQEGSGNGFAFTRLRHLLCRVSQKIRTGKLG